MFVICGYVIVVSSIAIMYIQLRDFWSHADYFHDSVNGKKKTSLDARNPGWVCWHVPEETLEFDIFNVNFITQLSLLNL